MSFKKMRGYHRQIAAPAHRVPDGLKGSLEKYKIKRSGKTQEIMMSPIGRSVFQCPFPLNWKKKPILVVHRGENASGAWQIDEAITGLLLFSGSETREAALGEVLVDIEQQGEKRFWELHADVCRGMKAGNVPMNVVEIVD